MLYLIQSSNHLKIGYTQDLESRLKHYKTHNPEYKLISTRDGNRSDEALLHTLLRNYFVNDTEWMYYDEFVIDCFNKLFLSSNNLKKVNKAEKEIKEDNFYMTFIDFVSPFIDNLRTCDNARRILVWLCKNAEYNTGKIYLTTGMRTNLCKDLDISPNTLTNNIKKLKEANLISGNKGDFIINPQIFWKGDLNTRRKLLEDSEIQIKFEIAPKSKE